MRAEQEGLSLDELCTDVLYRIPSAKQSSYWRHAVNFSDPISSFRQRHPNLRIHLSFHDHFLKTTSPSEANRLITYLKKIDSSGLDVIVNSRTNLSVLSLVLANYQRILYNNFLGLSITLDSHVETLSLVERGIVDLVDNVFLVPSTFKTEEHEDIGITGLNGLLTRKLVIGLPSVTFVAPNELDRSSIFSLTELCRDSNLAQWKPRIEIDDRVVWSNSEKKWKFVMQMGKAVGSQMTRINHNSSPTGILIFDVSFKLDDNPICSRHKTLFIDSVRQTAASLGYRTGGRRVKRVPKESATPVVKLMGEGDRLGKILIFATGDEDDQFRKYYSIYDEDTLLQSPVDHIILGFDDTGKIYDLYQQMPRELSQESIYKTIHQYYIDKILGGGGGDAFGAVKLHPPSIIVYPDAFGSHPIPILVTWVRVASPVIQLVPRKTRIPYSSSTTMSTTPAPITAVQRRCTDGHNPSQRCFIPGELMELLNLEFRPATTTTTTRKPTVFRQTTMKPAIPMHTLARVADFDHEATPSTFLGRAAVPKVTTQSPRLAWSFTLPPVNSKDMLEVDGSRVASQSKQQVLCNWDSSNSYVSCKTRNRRYINTFLKRTIARARKSMPKTTKPEDELEAEMDPEMVHSSKH